ncbi:MAG: DUF4149 domain-containing protein [Gemmatales bacterium]|nr:DUF4149 domain-containing protein [Gemmatales bacterium]MDW7995926.1 DUF4149 domain-containing protein [Gemmatales bacterium]
MNPNSRPPPGHYLLSLMHIMSVGVWLGAMVFFAVGVAWPVLLGMQEFARRPDNWLRLQSEKEGIRLAGEFLDLVFRRYFLFQLVCGTVAAIPAVIWLRHKHWSNYTRAALMALALGLVAVNQWWLGPQVHRWRFARYQVPEPILSDAALAAMAQAESNFQYWHTLSLGADLLTLALVLIIMGLVPFLLVSIPFAKQQAPRSDN